MYFAGLDAHLKYVSIAVLDRMGQVALETSVSTREPEQLLATLGLYRPQRAGTGDPSPDVG